MFPTGSAAFASFPASRWRVIRCVARLGLYRDLLGHAKDPHRVPGQVRHPGVPCRLRAGPSRFYDFRLGFLCGRGFGGRFQPGSILPRRFLLRGFEHRCYRLRRFRWRFGFGGGAALIG